MPFLRVLRDKRGYETTYLMHWFREGNRQRSRVLYVFRSPAGARVGRSPLDPEIVQELEQRYPDIAFDWSAIVEQQQIIEPAPEMRRRKPRKDDKPGPAAPSAAPEPAEPAQEREAAPVDGAPEPRFVIPAALEGSTPDEQIAFLDRVYPQVRDRIVARVSDPPRRQALLALAERLNPAAWTDADQITTGLQQAAEALERLSRVLSRRRRRRRRTAQGASSDGGRRPMEEADVPALDAASSPDLMASDDGDETLEDE